MADSTYWCDWCNCWIEIAFRDRHPVVCPGIIALFTGDDGEQ